MTESEEARLLSLSQHYHNEILYVVKLKDALERIVKACATPDTGKAIRECRDIAQAALKAPGPPDPWGDNGKMKDGQFTFGHHYPEYLHLPMRPSDDFINPHADPKAQ